jgi:hypothetical protein
MAQYRSRTSRCSHGCMGTTRVIYNVTEGKVDEIIQPSACPHKDHCWIEAARDMELSLHDRPPEPSEEDKQHQLDVERMTAEQY